MTHFNRKSISRGALATLLLAIAPFTFGADRPVPAGEVQMMGHIVVTAVRKPPVIRSIVSLGEMTVTADRSVLLADLGSMTVTANRSVTLADLSRMAVTASRDVTRRISPA